MNMMSYSFICHLVSKISLGGHFSLGNKCHTVKCSSLIDIIKKLASESVIRLII